MSNFPIVEVNNPYRYLYGKIGRITQRFPTGDCMVTFPGSASAYKRVDPKPFVIRFNYKELRVL